METLPQLDLDNQLCLPLYAASRAVTRRYTELLAEFGLTYPQYIAMVALWDARRPLAVKELGALLHLDSGTLTPLLKRLEAGGLVDRVRDAEDERRVLVHLTDEGLRLRSLVADVPLQLAGSLGIDETQARALRASLDTMIAALEGS